MVREQVLYAQFVNLRQKYLKFIAENKNRNEAKFKFQAQFSRSQSWFDIEFDCNEVNFSTHDPDLFKKPFQIHDITQDTNIFKICQVPIGNSKCVECFKFHNDAPMLKYCHKSLNSRCFSSLASYFASIEKTKSTNYISLLIEE